MYDKQDLLALNCFTSKAERYVLPVAVADINKALSTLPLSMLLSFQEHFLHAIWF